ncbi:MAG: hypothetical protein F6K47_15045 [Symploca sp. SIO2E6]|nr:hypothetical protein [Symploca sp. SIO2E6]
MAQSIVISFLTRELGIGNWELGIGNWELGIGNWEEPTFITWYCCQYFLRALPYLCMY